MSIAVPDNPLALEHQVCFALYSASRAVTAAYRPLLAPLGLTYPQYLVLLVLWEQGTLPVRDIGTALHLDSGTLSPLLKRLEAAGLVERRRATDDERQVYVDLTPAGIELRERAVGVPAQLVAAVGTDPSTLALLQHACAALIATTEEPQP